MSLFKWHLLASIILYAAIVSFTRADQPNGESHSKQLLEATNFRVISRIRQVRTLISVFSDELVAYEFYSNSQRKARIELYDAFKDAASNHNAGPRAVYYYDSSSKFVRQTFSDGQPNQCDPASSKQLLDDLFEKALNGAVRVSDGENWNRHRDEVPDYVLGAARLLFLVDSRRDTLEKVSEYNPVKIRNHDVVRYHLIKGLSDISDSIRRLRVSYAKTEHHEGGYDLPLRVLITLQNYDEILIDYSFIGPLNDEDHLGDGSVSPANPLDMFALPVGLNCSADLAGAKGLLTYDANIDISLQTETFQYSHQNSPHLERESLGERFFAYDGHADMLRADCSSSTGHSTTITDSSNLMKYNIFYKYVEPARLFAPMKSDLDGQVSSVQCIASKISDRIRQHPILPSAELTPMGRANVRGVECLAFELITKELPQYLLPHSTYLTKEGQYKTMFSDQDGDNFNLVYYFELNLSELRQPRVFFRQQQPLGQMMRVDVYQNSKLRYQMDILDCVYDLIDAPNGDRRDELFSLRDSCTSETSGNDGHASMALKLVASDTKATKNFGSVLKEAELAFASSSVRNNAIMRALAKTSSGILANMYDIESSIQLINDDHQKLEIDLESRLSVAHVGVSFPRVIGYVKAYNSLAELGSVEDCFFRVAHMTSMRPVLFASCNQRCRYDLFPRVSYSKDGNSIEHLDSTKFNIHPEPTGSSRCPMMIIEAAHRDSQPADKSEFFRAFRSIYVSLEGAQLLLPIPFGASRASNLIESLPMKVDRIEIQNDRWSVAQAYEKASADSMQPIDAGEAIDGIGLTESSGQLQTVNKDDQAAASSGDLDTAAMNYERCHSLCMARMSCDSFSVCITNQGIQCITSEVSFRSVTLLKQLDLAIREFKKSSGNQQRKGKTILVDYLAKDQEDFDREEQEENEASSQQASNGRQQIELRVDFRCKLYKKNVLELFRKSKPSVTSLRSSSVKFVDSLERCAEFCLQKNLIFFNKMKKTETNLLQEYNGGGGGLEGQEFLRKLRDEYDRNMLRWCSSFKYLNLATSSDADQIKSLLSLKDSDPRATKTGVCILRKSASIKRQSGAGNGKQSQPNQIPPIMATRNETGVKFEAYNFLYSNLYKAQYGIQLREVHDNGIESMPVFNTIALVAAREVEKCAEMCFLQTNGPKPACRSFDFIVSGESRQKSYCALNSITLAEIRRNNLTDRMVYDRVAVESNQSAAPNGAPKFKVWHYEPRSFTADGSMRAIAKKLATSEADLLAKLTEFQLVNSVHKWLAIVCLLLAAFACSVVLVVFKGETIIDMTINRNTLASGDELLIERQRGSSSNRVNSADLDDDKHL